MNEGRVHVVSCAMKLINGCLARITVNPLNPKLHLKKDTCSYEPVLAAVLPPRVETTQLHILKELASLRRASVALQATSPLQI